MTRKTPFLLSILQFLQIFFTEALTFIFLLSYISILKQINYALKTVEDTTSDVKCLPKITKINP